MSQSVINDRYRLEEELGHGGMGTVHRAFDTTLEREVAVKLVTGYEMETEGRARLLQEAKSIAKLNHPNIVTVYDAGEVDQAPYIVMELIEGSSLHDRPPENLEDLIQIAAQICMALDHAHERDIVHRDLKPENVLIDPDGNAKLMDFGIARSMASRLTQEGRIEGTVFYMAPELALGQEYDGRADLYALGVMLYELTTGELPFQQGDPVAIISQHVNAPVVTPRAKDPEIPAGLDKLIVQLMSKDPEDRPSTAAQILEALQQPGLLETTGVEDEQLSTLDRIVRGRMIGREAEFVKARELWYSAVEGSSQVVLISGEPGVGKTRLLTEIITQSEVMGAQVLGSASYAEGGPPYSPFKQILREVLPKASQNGFNLPEYVIADLLSLAPEFRAQFPEVPPNSSEDPNADQHRLFESFFILLATLSQHTPLLIYLDDAHWADSGSLNLFRHVARQLGSQPVMLLATYREIELDEARPLNEVLLDISREPQTSRIKLNRLTLSQTGDLLSSFFQDEITADFREGIYRETDGNPFFIEEVCKALVESGQLYFEDGSWHRPSMDELGIPQSVRVAIQSRVGKLAPETQDILSQAAVLGREFEFQTLVLAAEPDEDSLIDALEQAERAQLIEERSENGDVVFSFAHALIPSTLVEGLRILQRRRLHRRAGEALEQRDPENYPSLGLHFLEAGETEKGVGYLLLAGDQARAGYAHQEAIRSYLQVLDYAKESDDHALAARTLMKLGLTYHNAFEYKQSRQAYEEGFVYWQRSRKDRAAEALPAAPHALRVSSRMPPSLDPGRARDNTSHTIISQLFSGLVELTPDLTIVPDVAKSWDVLEGGRSYRFHLRDDALWSDGRPLTANDFESGWKRCLSPELDSEARDFLLDLEGASSYTRGEGAAEAVGVRTDGAHTLVVSLERPTGYFLQSLATPPFFPVPEHVVEVHGDNWVQPENIVSNGPFLLTALDPNSGLTMKQNPDYHGVAQGNVSQIEMRFARGASGELHKYYERDELDLLPLFDLSVEEVDNLRQRYPDDYLTAPVLGTSSVNFDVSRPPFDDARVRRAFCMAIDRESLAEITFRGYASPAAGGFVPPGMPGHVPGLALPYDPSRARQLLAEAGYADGSEFPNIECLAIAAPIATEAQAELQSQWAENLGVEITWEQLEWAEYLDRFFHEPPNLGVMGWGADYPDPDSFLRLGLKQVTEVWGSEPYDELMEKARSSMDQASRIAMYEQAQGLLAEEVPVFPLVYFQGHLLLKPWISQHPISPISWTFWKDVVIEPHD
jgi:ABC-type oligopeptide transport system substrate-binding subunit/serine/threonine protein kinase